MSSGTNKKVIVSSILFLIASFSVFGMNEQELNKKKLKEKQEILQGYKDLITDERHVKKYHQYFLYEGDALKIISLILDVDKDEEMLSKEVVETLRLLGKQCHARFDKSHKVISQKLIASGINTILYIDNTLLNEQKKLQIFRALISDVSVIGNVEHSFWLLQAIQEKNGSMIRYLIDEPFSRFLHENFYYDMFKLVTKKYDKVNFSHLQQIKCLHFFHKTLEDYFTQNHDIYSKTVISNDVDGKKDAARFNFLEQHIVRFMQYLHSKEGYTCLALAFEEKYWDYVDYCLERSNNKIGVTVKSEILHHILKLEALSDKEKAILVRHFIYHSKEQRTQNKILSFDNYRIFIELAHRKLISLLRYAIYCGLDLHKFSDEKNFIASVIAGWEYFKFDFFTKQIKTILKCLDEKDRKALLNPEKGIIPLKLFLKKNGLEMFKFLVKEGAEPWHFNDHLGLPMNLCTTVLMMNMPEKTEGYLDLDSRLSFVKYMVTHAKNEKKIDELLNKKNTISPLLCAITDGEDTNGVTSGYLIAQGARFNSGMFKYLVSENLYSSKEKDCVMHKLLKMIKSNELAPLLDHTMNQYSKDEIWKLVQMIEQSKRKDKAACLYTLFKNISYEVYQEIRKKIQNQQLKNIQNISWNILRKIEESIRENQNNYKVLHSSNVRYSNLKLDKENSTSIYARDKYLNLI